MADPDVAPAAAATPAKDISEKEKGNFHFGQSRRKNGSIPLTGS
jgi:hypothetical protein